MDGAHDLVRLGPTGPISLLQCKSLAKFTEDDVERMVTYIKHLHSQVREYWKEVSKWIEKKIAKISR